VRRQAEAVQPAQALDGLLVVHALAIQRGAIALLDEVQVDVAGFEQDRAQVMSRVSSRTEPR
jgi:hypothetical protein